MNRHKFNKKGFFLQTQSIFWTLLRMFLIVFNIGVFIYFLFQIQSGGELDDLQHELYVSQLLYSPQCFGYVDVLTKRADQDVLDAEKFTDATLESCLNLKDSSFASEVRFIGEDVETIVSTSNWNGASSRTHFATRNGFMVIDGNKVKGTILVKITPIALSSLGDDFA